jgi:hypothetical protein
MFAPANDAYKTMLKAFICAPLWYVEGIPRPSWLMDSIDGAGVGKTTTVELIAKLYDGKIIKTNKQQLKTNIEELTKRVVSTAGRLARVLLTDNVTGKFECAELADMMTAESISGKAPYGRGEESRPNNLTYAITANNATLDNDLSDRCFFIKFKMPKRSSTWKKDILRFIKANRLQVIADIIAMLKQGSDITDDPRTRFPEFEETILRPCCESREEYEAAMRTLITARADANVEAEFAARAEEEFETMMQRDMNLRVDPLSQNIFILGTLAEEWMREIFSPDEMRGALMQQLRGFSTNKHTKRFDAQMERIRFGEGGKRTQRRGILWRGDLKRTDNEVDAIIGLKGKKPHQFESTGMD